ncbi:MAG: D-alanyl-lipoteichoic acid biosynthesis protein DltB [Verrucomicrobiota bacterium]
MVPYADFTYFGLLLYVLLPILILGFLGRLNRWWLLAALVGLLSIQCSSTVALRPDFHVREVYLLFGYTIFQAILAWALLRWRQPVVFYLNVGLSLLPLAAAKLVPFLFPHTLFGFMGISYVTFRALDVLFSIHDGVVKQLSLFQYLAFLLFVPSLSSGPVDRYRRFGQDWDKRRTPDEFLDDLDFAIQRIIRGFLYKFILAALIKTYWMDGVSVGRGTGTLWAYMYAYTIYLFFDFAGYSAFAIGIGRIFGIKVPENFDKPFLATSIRDFWNRWHISLSFWFRDHVYMRFLLAASKRKWFKGKHTASYVGLFLTFGLMGVWHGLAQHYIIYGIYHALLLSGYDWFSRWNKVRKAWGNAPWQVFTDRVMTFHVIAFGLLIFSGRLTPPPPPAVDWQVEKIDGHEVIGYMWDASTPSKALRVDLIVDEATLVLGTANIYRQELRDRGYGDGKHGFRFELPWWVRDGRPHTVEIREAVTGKPLKGYPQSMEFERNDEEIEREEANMRRAQEADAAAREKANQALPDSTPSATPAPAPAVK